jgi:hypothetical protein
MKYLINSLSNLKLRRDSLADHRILVGKRLTNVVNHVNDLIRRCISLEKESKAFKFI